MKICREGVVRLKMFHYACYASVERKEGAKRGGKDLVRNIGVDRWRAQSDP